MAIVCVFQFAWVGNYMFLTILKRQAGFGLYETFHEHYVCAKTKERISHEDELISVLRWEYW